MVFAQNKELTRSSYFNFRRHQKAWGGIYHTDWPARLSKRSARL